MLKKLLLMSALSIGAGFPVFADAVSDLVLANLKAQGFTVLQMDRTWLGRMWILARNDVVQREVVFNPVTGEILRDYTVLLASLNAPSGGGSDRSIAIADPGLEPPVIIGTPPLASDGNIVSPPLAIEFPAASPPINPVQ